MSKCFPSPKPTGRGLGQKKSGKRKPIRARKSARPGRLKGEALEKLRRDCFERDYYLCQGFILDFTVDGIQFGHTCNRPITWESGHMAHVRNKRMWGDTLDNVVTKCSECHIEVEHAYGPSGVKPCPPKATGNVVLGG